MWDITLSQAHTFNLDKGIASYIFFLSLGEMENSIRVYQPSGLLWYHFGGTEK